MRVVALFAAALVLMSCTASSPSSVVATATVVATNTPIATVPPTSPPVAVASEAAAWSRVKSATQSSVAMPTWLPPSIDRSSVEVRDLVPAPAPPRYAVVYRAPQGAIVFALGPADVIPGSGIGTVVRGQDATLTFPSTVFADPTRAATRRVRWMEGTNVLSITSDVFSGDDLLRIAWNLDPSTAPPAKFAFSRAAIGACATAAPEDSLRNLVSLLGRHRADAMADCFSDEFLGRSGMGIANGWADLPTASVTSVAQRTPIGGRLVLMVSWTWSANPGGAWNNPQTMFFTLGLDHDRWRIFEIGTAGGGPAP